LDSGWGLLRAAKRFEWTARTRNWIRPPLPNNAIYLLQKQAAGSRFRLSIPAIGKANLDGSPIALSGIDESPWHGKQIERKCQPGEPEKACPALTSRQMRKIKPRKSIDMEIFERQARICKAFAHPGRLQILDLLGQGERGSSELQEALGISKTSLSQHLSVLRSAGVLTTRREGKQIYCSLAMPEVKQACQLIRKVLEAHIADSHRLIA